MSDLRILSLGWGIQSWTLAAMSALGELPKVDYAIHSDTTWEHQYTYEFAKIWGPWLEDHGIKYVCVSDESSRAVTMPTNKDQNVFIPAMSLDGTNRGQLNRQCTERWKIAPMRRWTSERLEELSLKKSPGIVEQWLGISTDEWMRAKDSKVKYIKHVYPLLDKKMNRGDCLNWLESNGLPSPGKSACVFCPYKNRAKWAKLKRDGGDDWEIALQVDSAIRDKRPLHLLYVHPDRKPLAEAVVIPEDYGAEQLALIEGFDNQDAECDSGYCFL